MNLGLENKRVLVTGSTGGIGEGIAKCFAQEGATVLINGRREEEAKRVVAEIQSKEPVSIPNCSSFPLWSKRSDAKNRSTGTSSDFCDP